MVGMVTQMGMNLQTFWSDKEVESVTKNTTTRKYLTIVNPSATDVNISVRSPFPFALFDTAIAVQSHYGNVEV